MSVLNSRPGLRWLVPAAAAIAVIGGGVAVGALAAAADPQLPQRSAADLLVDLQNARLDGLSGTVVQRADLGLPALPNLGGQDTSGLTSLVSGTHTLRVWYSGPDKARIALLGTLGENDVIANGGDVWTWSSKENTATHRTVDRASLDAKAPATGAPTPGGFAMTPQQMANLALSALDPSTLVGTDGSASIAGRDAYELVLTPRDAATRIASIRLAIDATEHVPLRVQVYARGLESPAIEVAFTQVSFARPDDQQFTFNPPPGAQVKEEGDTAAADQVKSDQVKSELSKAGADTPRPVIIGGTDGIGGIGWTSVVVAQLPTAGTGEPDAKAMLGALPAVSGSWGSGHLISSHLFSVLITDDGRVLVGAVSPDRLYQAAADPKAHFGS